MTVGAESARVLMVGGDKVLLDVSAAHIGLKYALDVQLADSANTALNKLVAEDYEAIVLVHKEPHFDGIEFTKRVRELGYQTPIIVYSSDRSEESILRALGNGANFYLKRDAINEGEYAVLFSLIHEASARHQAEEAIAHNAKRFSTLIQNTSELVLVLGNDDSIRYVNPSVERILGYEAEELMGRQFLEYLPQPQKSKWMVSSSMHKQHSSGSWRDEICVRTKNGSWAVFDFIAAVFTTDGGYETLVNARDITEKKNQEVRAERNNLLLRTIGNIHQQCLRNSDTDEMLRSICEEFVDGSCFSFAWIALLNERREFSAITEAGLTTYMDSILDRFEHGDPPACCLKALESTELYQTRPPVHCGDCPLAASVCAEGAVASRLSHNGHDFGTITLGVPKGALDREEEQNLLASVIEDVSFALHDVQLQNLFKSSEQKYKAIFENTGTAMAIDDDAMRILLVNSEFERLTSYSRIELENKMTWMDLIHEDDVDLFKSLPRVKNSDAGAQKSCEFRLVTKDGTIRDVLCFADLIPGTGNGVLTMFDLTDPKRMKSNLGTQIEAQKEILESMVGKIEGLDRCIKLK